MPRSNSAQLSFNAGELSPRLHARQDFAKYTNGLETCQNMIPMSEGGVMRRPGTRFVAATKTSSVKSNLFSFEASNTQAYVLEVGEQNMRFYRNQGQITAADVTASITNGDFPSGISSWTDQSGAGSSIAHDATNDRMSLTSNGTTLGHAEQQVTNATAGALVLKFRVLGSPGDFIKLRIGTSSLGTELVFDFEAGVGWHVYEFTATAADFYVQFLHRNAKTLQIDDVSILDDAAVELTTPWTESVLYELVTAQSVDILYFCHEDHPTYRLERRGHSTWALVEVGWMDGPYLAENLTSTTLTFAAATGLGVQVTASAITGINNNTGFQLTDIGRPIRLTDDTTVNWGWAVITGVTNVLTVTVDVKRSVVVTTAELKWKLGEWSSSTGYPSVCAFFEQRLFLANNGVKTDTLWASNTGDFENMAPDSANSSGVWDATLEDDDGLNYTLSADGVQNILWMSPGDNSIAVGTRSGEWLPSSVGAVLTPTDFTIRQQTKRGSARITPARVDDTALFVQRGGRKIREFIFAFDQDGYKAFDMTRLAEHITTGGIVTMAYQSEPHDLLWSVRDDGQLLSMTYRREEDVVGWGRHIIGGSFSGGDTVVEAVTVIPGGAAAGQVQDSTNRDETWVQVKRTINSSTTRYTEVFERDWENGQDQEDAYYADSIITYDSTSTTTITGLDHLEGETVKVFADGYIAPDKTVSSGSITLDDAASVVQIGLGYTHTIETLKILAGTALGPPLGQKKQIFGVTFVILNGLVLGFGPDTDNLREIDFRAVAGLMDTGVPFFTNERFEEWDDNWKTDPRIVVQTDAPAPFTLLALVPEIQTNESRG